MSGWSVRVIVLLLVVASYWLTYQHGRSVERAGATAATATRDSGDRLAEVLGERNARAEEQRRATAQEEARDHAHEERKAGVVTAAGAGIDIQRLRDDATKFATGISCTGQDTAAVTRGETARRAAMVLSGLLDRSLETNRELAKEYDQLRIAADQCATEYDSLSR